MSSTTRTTKESEQYFDSCGIFRDAVIAIVATVAKQERIRISERVKAGLETAKRKGQKLGRPCVYANRDKIAALRESGASWGEICAALNVSKGVAQRAFYNLSQVTGRLEAR